MKTFVFPNGGTEKGSALITAVLILLVVTVIGIIASRTATTELDIAAHDKFHKMTWFATDATVEGLGPELLERSINVTFGADDDLGDLLRTSSASLTIGNPEFYMNKACEDPDNCTPQDLADAIPTPSKHDIALDAAAMGESDVYVRIYISQKGWARGSSILMFEGYHGEGRGAARGGAEADYMIRGQGVSNNEARIASQWRHVVR
ncbi:MAG: pilus assembly PilX N-terminal domain-containing protein [Desulfatitalea sp.]|nr:pilus assembly PilX N-terminal domain-containing protein [Desulfatitalea sp.]